MGWRPDRDAEGTGLIVVDTSAWVEFLRSTGSPTHLRLKQLVESDADLAVTELVVTELLAGAGATTVQALRSKLLAYELLTLNGLQDFERAALLYRRCRTAGDELRGLTDCLIAVPTINQGAQLLHCDGDFDTLARHSELELYPVGGP